MTTDDLWTHLQHSPVAQAVNKSNHLVGAGLQVLHVFGFVLLLAALVLLALRLSGRALAQQPLASIQPGATRLLWGGFAAAGASGGLMFVASPKLYAANPAFAAKVALLLLAVALQAWLLRRVAAAPALAAPRLQALVALSVALWFAAAMAGRAIGFV